MNVSIRVSFESITGWIHFKLSSIGSIVWNKHESAIPLKMLFMIIFCWWIFFFIDISLISNVCFLFVRMQCRILNSLTVYRTIDWTKEREGAKNGRKHLETFVSSNKKSLPIQLEMSNAQFINTFICETLKIVRIQMRSFVSFPKREKH